MPILDKASGAAGASSGGQQADLSIRQRGTKHITRLALTLYAKYATLRV